MAATTVPAPFTVSKVSGEIPLTGKSITHLGRTETLGVGVQIVAPKDGETNLHSHPGTDSAWLVIDGQATFYGTEDDIEIAVLDKDEMIMIPGGAPYWFKASSDVPLVILHITARTKDYVPGMSRKDYKPTHEWFGRRDFKDGEFYKA